MENCGLSVSRLIGLFRRAKAKGGVLSLQCSGFRGVIGSGLQAIGSKGGGSAVLL